MENFIRIDAGKQQSALEPTPHHLLLLGGRGLSASILNKEVDPQCDPLGPGNKLIVAPGILAGTMAPSFGRISFGSKSPLTKGIKEANAGGTAAQKIDRLGFRAMILEGAPEGQSLSIIKLDKEGCHFLPADDLAGKGNYETAALLRKRFGSKISIISIGPAGEQLMTGASIAVSDIDGRPSRHAARGGLGAVMGAKRIKAIVIDDSGVKSPPLKDPLIFKQTVKKLVELVKGDKLALRRNSQYGTPHLFGQLTQVGSIPARNYTAGAFELFENFKGETIKEINTARGGTMHGCMPGCVVRCSIVFNDENGQHLTSALEYETLSMLGTNLGIGDVDAVARMDRCCDDLGVDTIEMGSAISQVMAAGKMEFGDSRSALSLLQEVNTGQGMGRAVGDGTVAVSRDLGLSRVPALMNQAIPAHDPRACKAVGVTYSTSPMGADHTAAVDYRGPYARFGQVSRSKMLQIMVAALDTVGYCAMAVPAKVDELLVHFCDLINARFGTGLTTGDLFLLGMHIIRLELEFNKKAGITLAGNKIPKFLKNEILKPSRTVFDVDQYEISGIWDDLDDWLGEEGPRFLAERPRQGSETGRVGVFTGVKRPFSIREYPLPDKLEEGYAIIKVGLANICASDLHMWRGESPCPTGVAFGHEFTGRVWRMGPGGLKDGYGNVLKEGDRVVVPYAMPCGTCPECVRGLRPACNNKFNYGFHNAEVSPHFRAAYGEYFINPAGNPIFKVPDKVDSDVVASANCACSQVMYGISKSDVRVGDSVVVQGIGGLGMFAVGILKEKGAGKVIAIDMQPDRLEMAKEFGADDCINLKDYPDFRDALSEVRALTGGGADLVVEVAGVPQAVADGLKMLAPGRTLLEMGNARMKMMVDIDPGYMLLRSLSIQSYLTYEPWALGSALKFMNRNWDRLPFKKFATDKWPFEDIDDAFAAADQGKTFRASIVFDEAEI